MGLFKVALLVVLLLQVASLGVNAAKAEASKEVPVSEAKAASPGEKGKGPAKSGAVEKSGVKGAPAKADESAKKSEPAADAAGSKVPGAPEDDKKNVVPDGDNGPAKKSVIPDAPVNGGGKPVDGPVHSEAPKPDNKSKPESATAISTSIPAVLISSVVFLYLYN
eukprot:Tbor_TRINITY_DN5626_c1_g1::TRINITY_DN5626_c1_g1_i18::g.8170::m.8170